MLEGQGGGWPESPTVNGAALAGLDPENNHFEILCWEEQAGHCQVSTFSNPAELRPVLVRRR